MAPVLLPQCVTSTTGSPVSRRVVPLVPPLLSYSSTCSRTQSRGLGRYFAIGTLLRGRRPIWPLSKIVREPYHFTRLESCTAVLLQLSKQTLCSKQAGVGAGTLSVAQPSRAVLYCAP